MRRVFSPENIAPVSLRPTAVIPRPIGVIRSTTQKMTARITPTQNAAGMKTRNVWNSQVTTPVFDDAYTVVALVRNSEAACRMPRVPRVSANDGTWV
jgi:hypothetical protein